MWYLWVLDISVSTSGIVPKIYEFADKNIQCTLSISLHSADNDVRSQMMPINNAYNIQELMKACRYYIEKTNKRISFEYALAKDNNDNLKDAQKLVDLLDTCWMECCAMLTLFQSIKLKMEIIPSLQWKTLLNLEII